MSGGDRRDERGRAKRPASAFPGGFQHAPGSPERRAADRALIEARGEVPVKNPRRYNTDTGRAFGIAHALGSGYFVELRGPASPPNEPFDSLDDLLDAGWTVD
jgi:hypothetical protein